MENPKITLMQLDALETAVDKNTAVAADYQLLDKYYAFFGFPDTYFLNNLRKQGISGYNDFIYQRRHFPHGDINYLIGTALGMILNLKGRITRNL